MEWHGKHDDRFLIELTRDEARIVGNALNEVCNGIDTREFYTRMGVHREVALKLHEEIVSLIDSDESG